MAMDFIAMTGSNNVTPSKTDYTFKQSNRTFNGLSGNQTANFIPPLAISS
jgi:hypothetical protein